MRRRKDAAVTRRRQARFGGGDNCLKAGIVAQRIEVRVGFGVIEQAN
jgi:hypothetical protein